MPELLELNPPTPRRVRRTPEQRIAELQAQLATIKERAARRKVEEERKASSAAATPPARAATTRRALVRSRAPREARGAGQLPDSLAQQLQSCVDAFTEDIVALVQRTTLDSVQAALSGLGDSSGTSNDPQFGVMRSDAVQVDRTGSRPRAKASSVSAVDGTDTAVSLEHYERMAIERALVEAGGDITAATQALDLTRSAIYRRIRKLGIRTPAKGGAVSISADDPVAASGEPASLEAYEKAAILRALGQCDGNIVSAAALLNVGKSTLYRRMEALGIPRGASLLVAN